QALNAGADLYLIKPVNFSDLAESIHALGARLRQQSAPQPTAPTISAERSASSTWILQSEQLIAPSGLILPLTQQEYRLLELLMRNRNEVCSKVDLHASLFTDEGEPELHRIDVVVSRLRHKARLQGMALPIRAIFGKGLAFLS
ncbi:response regulator transcription factor, partial [Klebsiella oxytoca]